MYVVESAKMLDVIDPESELVEIVSGREFTEGPIWDPRAGHLVFSDIPANTMYAYRLEGQISRFRMPSNHANGNAIDIDGRLVTCEHSGRRVTRTLPDGSIEVIAASYNGARLNSPNDVIVRSDGLILFTDSNYGIRSSVFGVEAEQEQPHQGVYGVRDEVVKLLVDDFSGPNGLALSPDESVLYVDDTDYGHIRSFAIDADGHLTGGDVFAQLHGEGAGAVDGMLVDHVGNIMCTGPGGVFVLSADGEQLGRIAMDAPTANLTWGPDLTSVFITSSSSVYRLNVRTRAPGIGSWSR